MDKPYFYINGHNFHISTSVKSESELNLIKNKMYVAGENYGYTDIQWTNFTGETISGNIYSRITEVYKGDKVQPDSGGDSSFYNSSRTPHAVLKYWAQNFVPCTVKTNIQSFESGTYVIDSFSQTNPTFDFVITSITLIQYEKPSEITQTYWKPYVDNSTSNNKDTSSINASAKEINALGEYKQECKCTVKTKSSECTASVKDDVKTIQKYLQQWGYFPRYTNSTGNIYTNGKFCYYTTRAIKLFQEDNGITVNGKFNKETKEKFLKIIKGT